MEGIDMAVTTNLDLMELLKSKGMNTAPFEPFLAVGVVFNVSMYSINAVKDGNIIAKATSPNVSTVKCLPALAATLLTQLQDWSTSKTMPAPMTKLPEVSPPTVLQELAAKAAAKKSPAMALLQPGAPVPETVSVSPNGYPVCDPAFPQTPILLRQATGLYRRVKGSGNNSVYFLLADYGDVKMAGRWNGTQFSIRFEADSIKKFQPLMAQMGLTVSSEYHASNHFSIVEGITARKLVYSMIGAFPKPLLSPLPEPEKIKDLGV